jgi:ketosteroid isomerase-like protein
MGAQEDANIAIMKKFYEMLAKGDRDWIYDNLIADDFELNEPWSLPYGGTYKGKDTVRRALKRVVESWDDMEFEILNYLAGGDSVVVHAYLGCTGKRTGRRFHLPLMEQWRIRDGKIIELRPFFFDTAKMCEVFGDN